VKKIGYFVLSVTVTGIFEPTGILSGLGAGACLLALILCPFGHLGTERPNAAWRTNPNPTVEGIAVVEALDDWYPGVALQVTLKELPSRQQHQFLPSLHRGKSPASVRGGNTCLSIV